MVGGLRCFFFILWEDDLFFYEEDEPHNLYGPYEQMNEAFVGLDELLRGILVDYWEIPLVVMMEGNDKWN